MKQFKPAVAALTVLLVIVLGWSLWQCVQCPQNIDFTLLAAAKKPPAKDIAVNDKMLHPYWGNCNKCHITTGAGKPVSQVMAAGPISIKDKMLHDYWGNCLLCHKVVDGFRAPAAAPQAIAAALTRLSAQSIGLKLQTVTEVMMREFGLQNEDGVFVLAVVPGSLAEVSGIQKGDEIIRLGKARVETTGDFDAALQKLKPGSTTKMSLYRAKKMQSLYIKLPANLTNEAPAAGPVTPLVLPNQAGAMTAQPGMSLPQQVFQQGQAAGAVTSPPMMQNQVETMAEQLGVLKTQQAVTQGLQGRQQAQPAAFPSYGTVAVAVMGPGLSYSVADQFGRSPYFIMYDQGPNSYRILTNPGVNRPSGRGVQAAQTLVDAGASSVIAGSFSPEALQMLHTLRVTVYSGVSGQVQNVISLYTAGQLMPTSTRALMQPSAPGLNQPRPGTAPAMQAVY
ncbi:MAG: NifB/NifX family molybdenum-iron cluster-binding protein [Pseudomonadota bacterium]